MKHRQSKAALSILFVLAAAPVAAQSVPNQTPTQILLSKARSLEGKGLSGQAGQTWKQVLMTDPNQPEALAGLALQAKQGGRAEEAKGYLDRLRKLNPNDPRIAEIDAAKAVNPQSTRLVEAGRLARNGQYEQAMSIYREVFGNEPPSGGWATAYYETLAATPGGWAPATAALQQLTKRYPEADTYRLSLGRLLTYHQETRHNGIALLSAVQGGPAVTLQAKQAWRQALVWEGATPTSAPLLRAYLSRYPDADLQKRLQEAPAAPPAKTETSAGLARNHSEQAAYESLKAGRVKEAQSGFETAIKAAPESPGALSGLGFVHMKQEDFDAAVQDFERAQSLDGNSKIIQQALDTARFWQAMQHGTKLLAADDAAAASEEFSKAAAMRPSSPDALQGWAGSLMKGGKAMAAVPVFEKYLKLQPLNTEAWREMVNARYQSAGAAAALATAKQMPPTVAATLEKNLDHLALLSSAYAEIGQDTESNRVLQQALDQSKGKSDDLSVPLQVQFAGLFLQHGRTAQASAIYQKVTDAHPDSVDAWQGWIAALLASHNEQKAASVLQRMPNTAYTAASTRPAFLRSVAAVYIYQKKFDTAETILQKALNAEVFNGSKSSFATQLVIAQVWLQQGRQDRAEEMLRGLVESHPDDPDVWKGYVAALHSGKRPEQALAASERIPAALASRLQGDLDYASLMAGVYTTAGDYDAALRLVRETMYRLENEKRRPTADLEIQLGWLLYNAQGDPKELYALLKKAGARPDLTAPQKKAVTEIWSAWTLRAAAEASAAGDAARSVALLDASSRMLPNDVKIRAALAGYLMKTGDTKRALTEYRHWGLVGATASDYSGAVGAALSQRQAQLAMPWLQQGLRQWPHDPQLLNLAGTQAADKLDYKKAERYWRAALANLPHEGQTARFTPGRGQRADSIFAPDSASRALGELLVPGADLAETPAVMDSAGSGARFPRTASSTQNLDLGTPVELDRPSGAKLHRISEIRELLEPAPDATAATDNVYSVPRAARSARQSRQAFQSDFVNEPLLDAAPSAIESEQASFKKSVLPERTQFQEISDQIAAVEARNSPYVGPVVTIQNRSGQSGFEKTLIQEADFEASAVLGNQVRFGIVAKPVYIQSGASDGSSELRMGLLPAGSSFGSQSASGLGAEAQISTQNIGLRFGATPNGFLVKNMIGGLRVRLGGGPISIMVNRDQVKDTLLSYAGRQDPVSKQIYGGVIANSATVLGNWGDAKSGFYASVGYQQLTGKLVATNKRLDGTVGSYWQALVRPEGTLTVGINLSAMHYDKNLRYFTLGQGGYFSPQQYYLLNVPVRWSGTWRRQLLYSVSASVGPQHFQEEASPFFPTSSVLQGRSGPYYPVLSSTGLNYNMDVKLAYQMTPHWFLGAAINLNNARNYSSQTASVFLKYVFENRPLTQESNVPSVPDWRGAQPFNLPW